MWNVEDNEIRIENNDVSSHILLVLFFIRLTLVSHYSAFSSIRGADTNVLNASVPREGNAESCDTIARRIMRGDYGPIYRYSLFVSHYCLHSRQWKRDINDANNIFKLFRFQTPQNSKPAAHSYTYFTVRLYGGNSRPVVPLKIILLSGELIDSALIKNAEAIAASMIKLDATSFINTRTVYIRTLLRDVNNDVDDGNCTSASYF